MPRRITVLLFLFLVITNIWAGIITQYGIDDHVGVNPNPGGSGDINQATENVTNEMRSGNEVGGTLLGMYNALVDTLFAIFVGTQPAARMAKNVVPPGIAQDLVNLLFGAPVVIIAAVEIMDFLRSGN